MIRGAGIRSTRIHGAVTRGAMVGGAGPGKGR